jgi:phosphate transport system permease protein
MHGLMYVAAALATLPLLAILVYLITKGASSIGLNFFTKMPHGVGEPGGGMANAITGTLILLGVACAVGLPVGLGAGLYLAEKARRADADHRAVFGRRAQRTPIDRDGYRRV